MEAPDRIEVNSKTEVVLTWSDGTRSVISAQAARVGCTCASCRSDTAATLRIANSIVPVTIEAASLVGAYALNLVFGPDGHKTGIFNWETLRRLGEQTG